MKKSNKRVVVLLSGGVDSSVAAYLLVKKGYEVIGVTLKLWGKDLCGVLNEKSCCSVEGVEDARSICSKLGIPHYIVNLEKEFKKNVIDYFCRCYESALTPNPCIICNEKIKFDLILNKSTALNADYVSSGHYARVVFNKTSKRFFIREAVDKKKDQSYVLFSLKQDVLSRLILPLGDLTKISVRALAKKAGFKVHDKLESQEICFVPDDNYGKFVMSRSSYDLLPGPIEFSSGKRLGDHHGIIHYTIGQRRGLGIAYKEPLYVTKIIPSENKIIVGTKSDTYRNALIAEKINWVIPIPGKPLNVKAKIRYNHKKADAVINRLADNSVEVKFKTPQSSPAPGQAVVFYKKDLVVGGGWIKEVI